MTPESLKSNIEDIINATAEEANQIAKRIADASIEDKPWALTQTADTLIRCGLIIAAYNYIKGVVDEGIEMDAHPDLVIKTVEVEMSKSLQLLALQAASQSTRLIASAAERYKLHIWAAMPKRLGFK